MRVRRVIWIAGGLVVLAVAAVLLIPSPKDRGVSAWLLASTNNVQTLIVTNGTPHLYYVAAVAVQRLSTNVMQQLPSHACIEIQVVVPGDAQQIMFMYSRMETGQLEHWIKVARALLGFQRSGMQRMYIDVPK